jgi:DNA-binding NtrC family response regulator
MPPRNRLEQGSKHSARDDADASPGLDVLILEDLRIPPPLEDALLMSRGLRPHWASDMEDLVRQLEERAVEAVLVKTRSPTRQILTFLKDFRMRYGAVPLVLLAQDGRAAAAVASMRAGATDYRVSPQEPHKLAAMLRKLALTHLRKRDSRTGADARGLVRPLLGRSAPMRRVLDMIRLCARSDSSVLILGETGTGKELVSRAIHAQSARSACPFVALNCGALPEGVVESEIFGYEKGAFTGASQRRKGYLEQAQGGTLFLDEVGEISPRLQVDLLRALEERTVMRLGGETPIPIDLRLICATQRDLEEACHQGGFREDFYYRINVVSIYIPPLRERREDIPLLAQHILKQLASQRDSPVRGFSNKALGLMKLYPWPGNVRELQNVIERSLVSTRAPLIQPEHLSFRPGNDREVATGLTLREMEERHIRKVLKDAQGNLSLAARALGISRTTLAQKVRRYGLKGGPAT